MEKFTIHKKAATESMLCNHKNAITYFLVGWPGSVFDKTVFSQSSLSKQTEHFFSKGEFLLGNSGYTGSP